MDLDALLTASDPARRIPAATAHSAQADQLYQRITAQVPPAASAGRTVIARVRRGMGRGLAAWGTGAPGRRLHGRAWRPAVALGIAVAVAAGLITAQAITPGASQPASALTVRELSDRAAAAALAGPAVRPGQWVFWKDYTADPQAPGDGHGITQTWSTADGHRDALFFRGRLVFLNGPFAGQPALNVARAGRWAEAFTTFWLTRCTKQSCSDGGTDGMAFRRTWRGSCQRVPLAGRCVATLFAPKSLPAWGDQPVISYAALNRLPRSPLALDRFLGRVRSAGTGPVPQREFSAIGSLLSSYLMPPSLTAELYRAIAAIPGVVADPHAADVAGRHGIGLSLSLGGGWETQEIVINPRTYRLMGFTLKEPSARSNPSAHPARLVGGTAFLRQALVSGPGVQPPH